MIRLESHPEGVILPVRAQPGAKASRLRGLQDGALKVAVTQVAEKGKANKAVSEVLVKQLRLRKSQVTLIAGATAPQKRFLVQGVTVADLQARIEAALAASGD